MKKIVSVLLSLLLILSFASCAGHKAEPAAKTSEDLYNGFLKGEERIFSDYSQMVFLNISGEEEPYVDSAEGYTITDLITRAIESAYAATIISDVDLEYKLLDCGADGEPELALSMNLEDSHGYEYIQEAIIKNIDGTLQLCHMTDTFYRYSESLTGDNGLVDISGSNSAASGFWGSGVIGADGLYKDLYTMEYRAMLGSDEYSDYGVCRTAAKYQSQVDMDWTLYICTLCGEDGTLGDPIFGANPVDEPLVQKIFEEAGVELHSEDELLAMAYGKVEALGLPESEDETEWTELDVDSVKNLAEIIKYGINPIHVGTMDELAAAIADNTTIVLAPGTYNLTEWLLASEVSEYNIDGENEKGILQRYEDMPEFVINGLDGLTIVSEDPENPAQLVSEPRYADVIFLTQCHNILIKDIIAGHTPEKGVCSGDVIGLDDCLSVIIEDCDLYGCGAYALCLEDSYSVAVTDTKIHDCSYGCVASYSSYASFTDCEFVDCEEYTMFEMPGSSLYFDSCSFKNLKGEMVYMDEYARAEFENCSFDTAALDSLRAYRGSGEIVIGD